jgi:hypothetical protein
MLNINVPIATILAVSKGSVVTIKDVTAKAKKQMQIIPGIRGFGLYAYVEVAGVGMGYSEIGGGMK